VSVPIYQGEHLGSPLLLIMLNYTNQFKKPLNKKDGFGKALISGCFAFGKTPAQPFLSPRRPQGGAD